MVIVIIVNTVLAKTFDKSLFPGSAFDQLILSGAATRCARP